MTDLVQKLVGALEGVLNRYVGLVESGDAGNWDAEVEAEVIAARAALSAAKDGGWLPIETAPVGVDVLLLSTRRRVHAFIGDWGDYNRHNHPRITHWQPLPNPPKEQNT